MRYLWLCLVVSSAAFADTVVTKDGVTHVGRILDKTEAGYLFREDGGETAVINFSDVDDVRKGDDSARRPLDAPRRPLDVPVAEPEASPRAALHSQMVTEWARLRLERDGISNFWPVTGLVVGSLMTLFGCGTVCGRNDAERYPLSVTALAVGPVLAVTGLIVMVLRIRQRGMLWEEILALETKAAALGFALPKADW